MVNKNNQNTSKQEISSLREDIDVLRKEIEAVEDKYLAVHRGESFWINSLRQDIDSLNYVIEAHRLVDMRQQNTIEALEDKIEALQKKINLLTEEAILGYQGTGIDIENVQRQAIETNKRLRELFNDERNL